MTFKVWSKGQLIGFLRNSFSCMGLLHGTLLVVMKIIHPGYTICLGGASFVEYLNIMNNHSMLNLMSFSQGGYIFR